MNAASLTRMSSESPFVALQLYSRVLRLAATATRNILLAHNNLFSSDSLLTTVSRVYARQDVPTARMLISKYAYLSRYIAIRGSHAAPAVALINAEALNRDISIARHTILGKQASHAHSVASRPAPSQARINRARQRASHIHRLMAMWIPMH
eukprot:12403537-Karenia_brevis.AAC.1